MLAVGAAAKEVKIVGRKTIKVNVICVVRCERRICFGFLLICFVNAQAERTRLDVIKLKSPKLHKQTHSTERKAFSKAVYAIYRAEKFSTSRHRSTTLTDKVQLHRVAFNGLSGNLAVVQTGISLLSKFDLQCPLVRLFVMCRCETLVSRVSVCSNS
jgi:hypothetical protein